MTGKLTTFGGTSAFGLPGSSAYGGAFNNSGIPDRVGSTSGADLNNVSILRHYLIRNISILRRAKSLDPVW